MHVICGLGPPPIQKSWLRLWLQWLLTIGVGRIFDWWGAKPQITCNDVIRNFERGIFCEGKDIEK